MRFWSYPELPVQASAYHEHKRVLVTLWRLLLLEVTLSQFWNGKARGKYAALKSYMPGAEET